MNTNLKAYEQKIFAKHHYRKLISAKTTINNNNYKTPLSRTLTPFDKYQYQLTNDKIRNKLTQIYKESKERIKCRKKTKKKSQSLHYDHKEKEKVLRSQNVRMYQKILTARSTICNFKDREKQLKKYSKITRRKVSHPEDDLFQAFRELLIQSRTGAKRSSVRPSSAKKSLRSITAINSAHSGHVSTNHDKIRETS